MASASESDDDEAAEDLCDLSRPELLLVNPFQLQSFSAKKLRYMSLFDTEQWAEALADVTFATSSAPVAWEEAVAIQHRFQEGCCRHPGKVTPQDIEALETLRCKIDGLLSELARRGHRDHYFVRLGPRSPKDAPMMPNPPWGLSEASIRAALERAALAAQEDVAMSEDAVSSPSTHQDTLHYFQSVCSELLKVSTGREALALLVSSSRVMQDISHALDQGPRTWDVSVVARAWDPQVRLEREFRAFVAAGRLCAVTQYDDQLYHPSIAANPQRILGAIRRGFAQALPGLRAMGFAEPAVAVVVDFFVPPGEEVARVVELNPFGPMTGASLFTWAGDRRVLQGGVDLYADLDAWEAKHPPGSNQVPACIQELTVDDVCFRFLREHAPNFTKEHLEVFWADYLRLAPAGLLRYREV